MNWPVLLPPPLPSFFPPTSIAPWLTLAPEDAAAADGASASAACLHLRSWLGQWDTAISWARAWGTCPDAWSYSGLVALGSCDTCFPVSWSWSCEDLKDTTRTEHKVFMISHRVQTLPPRDWSFHFVQFPPTLLKGTLHCFKLEGGPSDNTNPHLFTNGQDQHSGKKYTMTLNAVLFKLRVETSHWNTGPFFVEALEMKFKWRNDFLDNA